jgi:hypothetical protein
VATTRVFIVADPVADCPTIAPDTGKVE